MGKTIPHIILFVLPLYLLTISFPLNSQQSNTFFLMHDVPQSNLLNPAIQIECKWYVGLPALASFYSNYSNTAFTWNDLAGSEEWHFENVYGQMHRTDLVLAEAAVHPVSLGYRHRRNYFTLHISDHFAVYTTIPRELAGLALFGNSRYTGETANLGGIRPNALYFREYSAGYSRVINAFTTLGIRGKLLFGKANLYPGRSRVDLTTDESTFDLHLEGDYRLNSSYPLTIEQDANGDITGITDDRPTYRTFLLNRQNRGFAVDMGIIYRHDSRITLSASLLDIGFMKWNSDVNNIRVNGSFDYTGVQPGTDFTSGAYLTELRDSLFDAFEVTVSQDSYFSWLPAQLFFGGTYHVKDNIYLGLTNRNLLFRNKIHASFTFSAGIDIAGRLNTVLSWSYLNNSLKNIGAGLAYHGKGIQFHIVSDNLMGFLQPFDTRSINIRAGANLMLGCPGSKRERNTLSRYPGRLPEGNCGWAETPEFKRKYRKKAARRH